MNGLAFSWLITKLKLKNIEEKVALVWGRPGRAGIFDRKKVLGWSIYKQPFMAAGSDRANNVGFTLGAGRG